MIEGFELVTKEQAKKMIDEAPGDFIVIGKINSECGKNIYEKKKEKKETGKIMIHKAREIGYQNNAFFGSIILKNEVEPNVTKNILFPLKE